MSFLKLIETLRLIQNECFPVCISEKKIIKKIGLGLTQKDFFKVFFNIKQQQKEITLFAQLSTKIQMETLERQVLSIFENQAIKVMILAY